MEPAVALRAMARQPSLTSIRGTSRACLAEAREASEGWWSQAGSNRRPLACHASALPAELWPLKNPARGGQRRDENPENSSGSISSLLVAADVADDVGHVLVAFFLVGDEGGIVVIVVFNGLVDVDVVLGLRHHGLDLAGILLGIGFLQRHQLFGLGGLRHGFRSGCGRGGTGTGRGVGASPGRRNWRDRHPLAGIGRDHRVLVEIIEFLASRRANAFGSEIGFGHGLQSWEFFEKRCFTWLVAPPVSIVGFGSFRPRHASRHLCYAARRERTQS